MNGYSEYDVLTRTDRGTPAGDLLRRYWQPVALSEELPPGGAPVPLKIMGEELVAFRDGQGRVGLLGLHCSHRGADLSYGRLEDGGLRCIYHGWLYDVEGRCLEQPGEPVVRQAHHERSNVAAHPEPVEGPFHERIHHPAYPCIERSGAIFAYMGPGEPPLFPKYEFLTVPDEQTFAIKLFSECNYRQGSEGDPDGIHTAFLHQTATSKGGPGGVAALVNGRGSAPQAETIDVEPTPYGYRVVRQRPIGEDKYVHGGTYCIPSAYCFDSRGGDGYAVNWQVPIDDEHHWKFTFAFSRIRRLDKESMRRKRQEMTADYRPLRNKANRYLQDRESMKTESYSGIGTIFQAQDLCATEGAGPIQDRSQEHLTPWDIPIVAQRNFLLRGLKDIAEGRDPPNVLRDPEQNHFPRLCAITATLPQDASWRAYWRELDLEYGEVGTGVEGH